MTFDCTQVDKIVDQLMQYIYNYDLTSLRELWGHLDTRMFCRLESHFTPAIRKLENSVLKMYLVNAAVNGKQDKIQEFFARMAPELQGHSEWKEWFGIYIYTGWHALLNRVKKKLTTAFVTLPVTRMLCVTLQRSPLSKIPRTIRPIPFILANSGTILCWYPYTIS